MTISVLRENEILNITMEPGQTLLDALRGAGLMDISAPCGGTGTCGKCRVYLAERDGEKSCLACRTPAEDGMVLRLPDDGHIHVEQGGEACFPGDGQQDGYGIACDIGTTTVVCKLVELKSGEVKGTVGAGNTQRSYGADLISRIKASMDGKLNKMSACIRSQLSSLIRSLCLTAGISLDEVHIMSVAGNTVMCHLFAGIKPDSMGIAPYIPESTFGNWLDAKSLNLPFDAEVYIAPAVSGYVGGDITADILAANLDQRDELTLLIDVGTNGEMALGCGDHFLCCATAAGPTFEGAEIRFGMTAGPGAISRVEWRWGQVTCDVIGGTEPMGICGTGLIDAVAVLLESGAVDETGRMLNPDEDLVPEELEPYLYLLDGEPAFCLAGDVSITQSDVRKLQLGKGAIAAGVEILRELYGETEIMHLILAGGFGSYIRPESAARIGLIPRELLPVTHSVGNTAILGAQMALNSQAARARLDKIQQSLHYQELSGMDRFSQVYLEKMMFPK